MKTWYVYHVPQWWYFRLYIYAFFWAWNTADPLYGTDGSTQKLSSSYTFNTFNPAASIALWASCFCIARHLNSLWPTVYTEALNISISTSIPPGLSSETTFFNAFAYDGTSGQADMRHRLVEMASTISVLRGWRGLVKLTSHGTTCFILFLNSVSNFGQSSLK